MRSSSSIFTRPYSRKFTAMNSERSSMPILLVGPWVFPWPLGMLRRVVEDVTQGAPYCTGTLNALTPQFKRIASIQGDWLFQGPRRFLLQHLAYKQNAWSFGTSPSYTLITVLPVSHIPFIPVSNENKTVPVLGSVRDDPHPPRAPSHPDLIQWFSWASDARHRPSVWDLRRRSDANGPRQFRQPP